MGARRSEWWQRRATPPWSVWKITGVVLAALLAIAGLAVLGYYVVLFVVFSQWGSNK